MTWADPNQCVIKIVGHSVFLTTFYDLYLVLSFKSLRYFCR